jgi:transcription elongation factor S-II
MPLIPRSCSIADLAQDTKVGMVVNKLRMNGDKSVSELAKEIVAKWKKDVHQKNRPGSSSDIKKPAGEGQATVSPTPPKPSGKKPSVDPSQRNRKTDGVNWQCTGDSTRDNCLGMMYDALAADCDAGMSLQPCCHEGMG